MLRHTAAMRLLHAGVDTSVIALWLGHEQVDTTQIYLHADLSLKERALARTAPPNSTPGRYRPSDPILAFLEAAVASIPLGIGVPDETVAKAARAMNDQAAARRYLEIVVVERDTVPIRLALARVALQLNDLPRAREHARRVLELDRTHEEAARILRDTGG